MTAFTRHTLANGLTILARERRQAPVVTFFVWYRVGARNELPGITGISHWVEHMLFKGTPRFGKGELDRLVSGVGGQWNGFTWLDFTAYFERMPEEHLDLALDIEADRMVNAIFDPDEVESERTVIISERQGLENHPGFWLGEATLAAAYQAHPYRQGVIGSISDLQAITRDDLYRHYRRYYVPNNAVVVAVGDFAAEDLISKVDQVFGAIPQGEEEIPPVRVIEPKQQGERRVTIRRPGPAHHLNIVYHAPPGRHDDIMPLMVADGVLSGGKGAGGGGGGGMGKSSRFYRRLVDSGLATQASSHVIMSRDPGIFEIDLTLRSEADPRQVEETVLTMIDELAAEGPSAEEFARAVKQMRAQLAYGTDGVLSQAMLLGRLAMIGREDDFDRLDRLIDAVTPDQVRRAAAAYLHEDNRTVGWFVPRHGPAVPDTAAETPAGTGQEGGGD
ncbi:MAG: pitrilysin family protein [Thermaerobacterales bacterium]